MNSILILLLFVSVIIIINLLPKNNALDKLDGIYDINPYISKQPLTPTEVTFYNLLVEALPEFIVLAQVQLASFIKVNKSQIDRQETYKWQNPLSQQSVDYLICTKDFSIVAAIELDDKSHLNRKAIERDIKKNKNIATAKIALIRWHAEDMPEIDTIKRVILSLSTNQINDEKKVDVNKEEKWMAEDQQEFFKRTQNKKELPPLSLIMVMSFIVFLGWLAITGFKSLKLIAPSNTQTTPQPTVSLEKNSSLSDLLEQQRLEQAAKVELKRQNKITEQQLINQKEQLEILARADKEDAWKQYYKKSPQCEALNDVVACGNEYIISRNKFEIYWEKNNPH